jgi:hypothetical protein
MISNYIDDDIFSIYFSGLQFNVEKNRKRKEKRSMLKTLTYSYLSTKVKIQNPGKMMILPVLFSSARTLILKGSFQRTVWFFPTNKAS